MISEYYIAAAVVTAVITAGSYCIVQGLSTIFHEQILMRNVTKVAEYASRAQRFYNSGAYLTAYHHWIVAAHFWRNGHLWISNAILCELVSPMYSDIAVEYVLDELDLYDCDTGDDHRVTELLRKLLENVTDKAVCLDLLEELVTVVPDLTKSPVYNDVLERYKAS